MKKLIYLICILFVLSCTKESVNDSTLRTGPVLFIDSISTTKYYSNEIFTDTNLRLYGRWQFSYIYDDVGFSIGPGKLAATYDLLEIKKFGIYGKIKNNQLVESGKLVVVKQDNSPLFEINLKPDKTFSSCPESWYYVFFEENDSLKFLDATIGCGYLCNAFKRKQD